MKFYDRVNEMQILQENEVQAERSAVFTVLMGRRRVGKTSLITHAMEGREYAYLFISRDNEAVLCRKLQRSLEEQLGIHVYGNLTHFRDLFEVIMRESVNRHFTVVFDEFQTLYKINPAIFSEIQDIWDRYHTESKLNLIASGSIQSLMKRIFEDENEPLYGRPTSKFTLRPFTIAVLKEIMADHSPKYSNEDLLCLYMITGGVAKYVELLMDAQCYTKEKMLNYVCRQDSYFLTEGRDIVNQEFSDEGTTYFSILQMIAEGMTRRGDIDGAMQKDMGVYLQNLEKNYNMISRLKPLLAKTMETGLYTQVGNWWDRKGLNEIDMIALNEFDHTAVAAEIKRNPKKISMSDLQTKVDALPKSEFKQYQFELKGLSIEDM